MKANEAPEKIYLYPSRLKKTRFLADGLWHDIIKIVSSTPVLMPLLRRPAMHIVTSVKCLIVGVMSANWLVILKDIYKLYKRRSKYESNAK